MVRGLEKEKMEEREGKKRVSFASYAFGLDILPHSESRVPVMEMPASTVYLRH